MTPKEKAIELVLIFKQRTSYREVFHTIELLDKFHNNAIDCALITVNNIFYELNSIEYTSEVAVRMYYWHEVKQEIEKL